MIANQNSNHYLFTSTFDTFNTQITFVLLLLDIKIQYKNKLNRSIFELYFIHFKIKLSVFYYELNKF